MSAGYEKEKKEASRAKYRNVEKRCEVANLMVLLVNVGPNILSNFSHMSHSYPLNNQYNRTTATILPVLTESMGGLVC